MEELTAEEQRVVEFFVTLYEDMRRRSLAGENAIRKDDKQKQSNEEREKWQKKRCYPK